MEFGRACVHSTRTNRYKDVIKGTRSLAFYSVQIYGELSLVTGCDDALEVCCLRVRSIDRGPFMQRVVDSPCTCAHRRSKVLLLAAHGNGGSRQVGGGNRSRRVVTVAWFAASAGVLQRACNSARAWWTVPVTKHTLHATMHNSAQQQGMHVHGTPCMQPLSLAMFTRMHGVCDVRATER